MFEKCPKNTRGDNDVVVPPFRMSLDWIFNETNTACQLILDLSKSKLRMRSQVWESLKKIGWTPVYFGHFDVQKKVSNPRSIISVQKYVLLFTKVDFWSSNSIYIKSIPTNSVTIHPWHLKLFFCTSKYLNYLSFTGICDRSGSFWDLILNLLFEARCKFSKQSECYTSWSKPDRWTR